MSAVDATEAKAKWTGDIQASSSIWVRPVIMESLCGGAGLAQIMSV